MRDGWEMRQKTFETCSLSVFWPTLKYGKDGKKGWSWLDRGNTGDIIITSIKDALITSFKIKDDVIFAFAGVFLLSRRTGTVG